ncbi:MAG: MFS transporter [Vulcanimicrobiota bacterium]
MSEQDRKAANIAIGFSVFLFTIDLSIVNVGLPTIRTALQTDYSTVQWVVLSYLVVIASFLMGAARLGDLHDKKKLFLGGLAVFTFGSGLCAVAPTIELLIAARALQGLGAVFVSALGMAIVTAISPPEERGRNLGIVGGIIAIGVALGPTIGGVLLEYFAWPSIFLVNLPIGVGAGLAIWKKLPNLEPKGSSAPFDWPALAGLAVILTSFSMAVNAIQRNGFENPLTLGGLLLCLVLLPLVVRRERRLGKPSSTPTCSTPLPSGWDWCWLPRCSW